MVLKQKAELPTPLVIERSNQTALFNSPETKNETDLESEFYVRKLPIADQRLDVLVKLSWLDHDRWLGARLENESIRLNAFPNNLRIGARGGGQQSRLHGQQSRLRFDNHEVKRSLWGTGLGVR